jgi:hypothetical protein
MYRNDKNQSKDRQILVVVVILYFLKSASFEPQRLPQFSFLNFSPQIRWIRDICSPNLLCDLTLSKLTGVTDTAKNDKYCENLVRITQNRISMKGDIQ